VSANARPLVLTDLPLLALAGRQIYPNHAVTLQHGDSPRGHRPSLTRLLRSSLQPGGRQIWVSRDGLSILGLAAVRPRLGRSAWEIDTLILGTRREAFVLDLLERCISTAGAHGAHRLFLRLRADSPLIAPARRQGFVEVCQETLLTASGTPAIAPAPTLDGWRRRGRSDDHDLFRLYNDVVPNEIRWQTALAPSEWRATLDPLARQGHDWLLPAPEGDPPRALARLTPAHRGVRAALLATDTPGVARAAIAFLTSRAKPHRLDVFVPDYLPILTRTLTESGFAERARYALLVRPIAQRTQRLQLTEQSMEGTVRPVLH
jgi:hypothetical protein